jgi:hypothetical protein
MEVHITVVSIQIKKHPMLKKQGTWKIGIIILSTKDEYGQSLFHLTYSYVGKRYKKILFYDLLNISLMNKDSYSIMSTRVNKC